MKIYNTTVFEKLKINPINIKTLNNVDNHKFKVMEYDDVLNAVNIISDGLRKYCMYQYMSISGIPHNMGKLLSKYGSHCEYAIRPKEWDVEINTILEDDVERNVIDVYWVTQSYIDSRAEQTLENMFRDLIELCDVSDFEIYFYCGVRDSYCVKSPDYDVRFKYDPIKKELFLYDEQ